ncbi:MAG: hypothetical protein AAB511_00410, partial [Patescibacteria group bacterium]
MRKFMFALVFCSLTLPVFAEQTELLQDTVTTVKAEVREVLTQETKNVPGTDVTSLYQTLSVKILEGEEAGRIITL